MSIMERFDFSLLSVDEKVMLVHELWDDLHREMDSMQLDEAVRKELASRFAAEESGEMEMVPWESIRARWAGDRK